MRKKKQAEVVPAARGVEVLKPSADETPQPKRASGKCVVCGSDVAPFSSEQLCWVCRRLKISAWRDTENQAAVQE
jgi:hypothetical protein